jgi:hypothetical protein
MESISRRPILLVCLAIWMGVLSACGGGAGPSSGGTGSGSGGSGGGGGTGGGGGGGNFVPAITLLSPSTIMVGVPLGIVNVYGTNISGSPTVYIDGTAAQTFGSQSPLEVILPDSLILE